VINETYRSNIKRAARLLKDALRTHPTEYMEKSEAALMVLADTAAGKAEAVASHQRADMAQKFEREIDQLKQQIGSLEQKIFEMNQVIEEVYFKK
jgi:TolA-binding protein